MPRVNDLSAESGLRKPPSLEASPPSGSDARTSVPLVVDIDGTLIRSDLLIETALQVFSRQPLAIIGAFTALFRGKAPLKTYLAERSRIEPATLPYNSEVLAQIEQAKAEGRRVILASASHESLVEPIARHIGADAWFGTTRTLNLEGVRKRDTLTEAFGEGCFDYIGNAEPDLHIWRVCGSAVNAGPSRRLARKLDGCRAGAVHLQHEGAGIRTYLKALRVHQYSKNALIFVPLVTAHTFDLPAITAAVIAFIAFSLCASSVYLLNDLVDLDADRSHPTKKRRPFAAGAIPLTTGMAAIPILLVASMVLAAAVSWAFLAVLAVYYLLTTAYSFFIKRKMIIDSVVLSMLYTARVVAGGVATGIAISEWLLAFALFFFFCLALLKRFTELATRLDAGLPDPSNRNYKIGDLNVVLALAAASGMNAVTVFCFYLSSPTVKALYSEPLVLWLLCPLFIYWLARMVMLANRRALTDDPIVFAIRDRISLAAGVCAAAILAGGMLL